MKIEQSHPTVFFVLHIRTLLYLTATWVNRLTKFHVHLSPGFCH